MDTATKTHVVAMVLLVCLVRLGEGGECCRASYDILSNEYSTGQKWCDNYCCFNLLQYDCCDNLLTRAPADMRMNFCMAWFEAHWYVPLLVALAIVGGIITCCVCCCCACCRNTSGTVMSPPPQSMMVISQQPVQSQHAQAGTVYT
ncbi:uncharacterized protein [Argopecten irradians]|uniref:uncharacterized protein n=1 Tax=Argopecten irradians TaxID=31199 RepID=UPI00371A91E2